MNRHLARRIKRRRDRSPPMTHGAPSRTCSPDTDDSLSHLGVVGDTYTILVSGADTGWALHVDRHARPAGRRATGPPSRLRGDVTVLDGEIEFTFRVSARCCGRETINVPANAPHVFQERQRKPGATALSLLAAGQEEFFRRSACRSRTERGPARRSTRCRQGRVHRQGDRARPRSTGPNCCSAGRRPRSSTQEQHWW